MISADTVEQLESPTNRTPYILEARMRKVKKIRDRVLSHPGSYKEVRTEISDPKKRKPLKVKQVQMDGCRYSICLNPRQQRKDAADREAIVKALTEQLKKGPKSLVGNKGFRKYLKVDKDSARIDEKRVTYEARFDGKWVLQTNTDLSPEKVALKYKELWRVERVFRDVKSLLETRPIFHQKSVRDRRWSGRSGRGERRGSSGMRDIKAVLGPVAVVARPHEQVLATLAAIRPWATEVDDPAKPHVVERAERVGGRLHDHRSI